MRLTNDAGPELQRRQEEVSWSAVTIEDQNGTASGDSRPLARLSSAPSSPFLAPNTALLDRADTSVLVHEPGGSGCQSSPALSAAPAAGGGAVLAEAEAEEAAGREIEADSAAICRRMHGRAAWVEMRIQSQEIQLSQA